MYRVNVLETGEVKATLECPNCYYIDGSKCLHPEFKKRKLKPLIIANEGEKYPGFCPLEKKNRRS